jgi:hypothetical protein
MGGGMGMGMGAGMVGGNMASNNMGGNMGGASLMGMGGGGGAMGGMASNMGGGGGGSSSNMGQNNMGSMGGMGGMSGSVMANNMGMRGGSVSSSVTPSAPAAPALSVSDTVIVRNLPVECNWQALREGFSHCGEIKYAEMKERGTGLVRFNSERDAERAMSKWSYD